MYKCYGVTVWVVLASAVNGASAEYLLRVEEVDGLKPQIEQTDGTSTADYGWLPVADVDSEPIQIGRHIEILVSTGAEFHLRFSDGAELNELKGRLQKGEEDPAQVPVLTTGSRRSSLKKTDEQRPEFVVEYEYAIEVETHLYPDIPSYSRTYVQGTLPICSGRKFCLGGGLTGARDFPTTLWSLEETKAKSVAD